MMKRTCLTLAIAVCAVPQMAAAHDVWLTAGRAEDGSHAIVNYGHPHDRPPALADKIVEFVALTGEERVDLMGGLTHKQTARSDCRQAAPLTTGATAFRREL